MKILFEDKNIFVCEKPVGVLCEEKENTKNMVDFLKNHKKENNEDDYIGVIHRLDVNTGGVIVYAKNKKAAAVFSSLVSDKDRFTKEYLAVIHGCPEEKTGVFKDYIFKDSKKNKSFLVNRLRKGVKDASLEYEVISTTDNMSLVKIKLHTGRTHQIRVQFSGRKLSLVGDGKYGSKDNRCETALWAYKLMLENPFSKEGERKAFVSKPDFSLYPWNLFDMKGIFENEA